MSTNCSNPPKIANGFVVNADSHANYSCNSGYALYGTATIYCDNGYWDTDDFPTCLYIRPYYNETNISITTLANTTLTEAEKFNPVWYWYGMVGAAGLLFLCVVVCCLLSCCHICGCCPGPVVGFGGRYQLSDRRWYSLLNWCDFMTKGKVCRKIRRRTETKVGIPHEDQSKKQEENVKIEDKNQLENIAGEPKVETQPKAKQESTVNIVDETRKPKSIKLNSNLAGEHETTSQPQEFSNSSTANCASSSSTSSSPEPGDDPTVPLVHKLVVIKKIVKTKKSRTLHQPTKDKTNSDSPSTGSTAGVKQPLVTENKAAKSTTKRKLIKRK